MLPRRSGSGNGDHLVAWHLLKQRDFLKMFRRKSDVLKGILRMDVPNDQRG